MRVSKLVEVTADELRLIQLELLATVDEVCRSENIEYSLAGGSLLGAIRHGGFIPWDDDIDIVLHRNEYQRLLSVLRKLTDSPYRLYHYHDREISSPITKIYDSRTIFKSRADCSRGVGVYIDIFVVDAVPLSAVSQAELRRKYREKSRLLKASSPAFLSYAHSQSWYKRIGKTVFKLPLHLRARGQSAVISAQLDDLARLQPWDSGLCAVLASQYKHAVFPASLWSEYEDVQFEQHVVRKVANHDLYLSTLYQNYMKLPPIEKQIKPHSYYTFYWKPLMANR